MNSEEVLEKINSIKSAKDKILNDVYKLDRPFQLTDEEQKTVIEIFKNPEMFSILRKALNIFSFNELGIEQPLIKEELELEVDSRIRTALGALYQVTANKKKLEKEKEITDDLIKLQEFYEKALVREKEEVERLREQKEEEERLRMEERLRNEEMEKENQKIKETIINPLGNR